MDALRPLAARGKLAASMNRSALALLLMMAACGGAPPPVATPPPTAPPVEPRPHTLQPLDLVLHEPPEVGVQWAIVERYGQAWLGLDAAPLPPAGPDFRPTRRVAVAEVRDDRVRIVASVISVRVLLWIERETLATVTRREAGLQSVRGGPAAVPGKPGVILAGGAELSVFDGFEGQRIVTVQADGLYLGGLIADDAIGDVWLAEAGWPEPAPTHWIAAGTEIQAERSDDAAGLALSERDVEVRVLGEPIDGWSEVELTGRRVQVRGFVRATALTAGAPPAGGDGGFGYGYGAPGEHESVELPESTCLYDRIHGEVIGVQTHTGTLTATPAEEPGWWNVQIRSLWGSLTLAAHAPIDGTWTLCR